MLDVLHYLFEEEFYNVATAEHLDARDKAREVMYSQLYDQEYKYSSNRSGTNNIEPPIDEDLDIGDIPEPIDPFAKSKPTKPYVPPTKVDLNSRLPFGAALDSPLG